MISLDKSEVNLAIDENNHLMVKSSYGAGGYAAVPWVAIMDTRITTSTQTGTYIVFLFAENGESCDLKIGQGVTEIQKELIHPFPEEMGGCSKFKFQVRFTKNDKKR